MTLLTQNKNNLKINGLNVIKNKIPELYLEINPMEIYNA